MTAPSLVPALELRDVRKSFGNTAIIRGTDLVVQSGERVAIIGPNGAGKSTLFNLICCTDSQYKAKNLLRSTVWACRAAFRLPIFFLS